MNINKANAAALRENLTGIGPVKAQAITDYRRKHGAFKRLDGLTYVPSLVQPREHKFQATENLRQGRETAREKRHEGQERQESKGRLEQESQEGQERRQEEG